MGPKKNMNSNQEKSGAAFDDESDTDDEQLRQTIQQLEERLKLANEEKNKERSRAAARER